MIRHLYLCLCLLGIALHAAAAEESLRPGGIAIVDLGSSGHEAPDVSLNGKPVLVMSRANRWYAVVGISLNTSPGELVVHAGNIFSQLLSNLGQQGIVVGVAQVGGADLRRIDPSAGAAGNNHRDAHGLALGNQMDLGVLFVDGVHDIG